MLIIDNNVFHDIGAKISNRDLEDSHPIEIATRDVEHAADLKILNELRQRVTDRLASVKCGSLTGSKTLQIPIRSLGNVPRTLLPFPFCAISGE